MEKRAGVNGSKKAAFKKIFKKIPKSTVFDFLKNCVEQTYYFKTKIKKERVKRFKTRQKI
ncbi:MAG: hypothetical protein IIY32_03600 [Thermoguttaceae bacterium]|nr:hypothetical protein [Thermoguttaceae bacterium]